MYKLSDLKNGDIAIITRINSTGEYSKRLTEMGFVRGRRIVVIKNAPLKDPIEYELMGYSVSLRRREASLVEVKYESELTEEEKLKYTINNFTPNLSDDFGAKPSRAENIIRVALIGNPNCGKTTLFNAISGLNERVGNFSGITVSLKETKIEHKGYTIKLTDLPGTYSLSTYSPEEEIVKKELSKNKYDYIINVIDSTLLERSLYLTSQLMDMGHHIVIALNMYDELQALDDKFDHIGMGNMLDIPFIPTISRTGEGINEVFDTIVSKHSGQTPHTHVESNLGEFIEEKVSVLTKEIEEKQIVTSIPKRYASLGLIESGNTMSLDINSKIESLSVKLRKEIEAEYKNNIQQVLADARYDYVACMLKETLETKNDRTIKSRGIDVILTHKFWGYPIFLVLMWFMFYVTFTVGAYPQDWIDSGITMFSDWLSSAMPSGPLKDLVIDGIIGGVGSVIVFLPNIVLLFLFISILEDSGYMSRAAFIMDRLMRKIGLHGKSFVPLIMGFGCNVPAIMATRIIEDRNNRLLTAFIVPFMSCSARLPVYILLIGVFFPKHPSLVLFGLYVFGVLLAILTSIIMKKLVFKGAIHPFVMELPPYRLPLVRNTLKHMWNKSGQYLKKMGGIILVGAVIIWALGYYPTRQNSYLERIGHTIEPAIAPLGFDWKMGVSLVTGVAAKEIVISTMGVLHNIENIESGNEEQNLKQQLKLDRYTSGSNKGELIFTTPVTLSFLAFVLIYFPCLAVVAAIKRESGSWKWAVFSLLYTTSLAWVVSYLIYNIGSMIV